MKRCFLIFTFLAVFIFAKEDSLVDDICTEDLLTDLRQTLTEKNSKIFSINNFMSAEEISTNELIVDLKNPNFTNGILTTHEGGVIKNSDMRIQAKTIQYIKRPEDGTPVHKIEAEGSLMMVYKDMVFVGDELEYDFITKTGVIYNGKTFARSWYLRGDKIYLKRDGSYKIENVSITTCENKQSSWDIFVEKVSVENRELMSAKNVHFRLFELPTIWIPSFKLNIKKIFKKPIIQYKIDWKNLLKKPGGYIRYNAYSWKDLALFLRFDYRYKLNFGGAIETEYFPSHKRTSLLTSSYIGKDMIPNDPTIKMRYRYQGEYKHKSVNGRTSAFITWDKYSDLRMPNDFKSDDFEMSVAKKTEILWRHQKNDFITTAHAQARINSFETINQDLPTIYVNIRPMSFAKTGIIFSNWAKFSYLDYVYSKDISGLNNLVSMRGEIHNELYKPIRLSGVTITPKIGFTGIYYHSSPDKDPKAIASFLYGGRIQTDLFRYYDKHKHIIEPYAEYRGITSPQITPEEHYIFSIDDGYNSINMVRVGILNRFFTFRKYKVKPTFEADIYTNLFLKDLQSHLIAPKGYLNLTWNLSSLFLFSENGWNFNNQSFDFSNARLGWTVNENIAVAVEIRYRSKYEWRKADRDNYIMNVSRPEDNMLTTPLSDKRCTFLTHLFVRINPYWACHFQSFHGWNRNNEAPYNEFKIDFDTLLSSSWKVRLSFSHTELENSFSFTCFLIKF